jgi:serine/threonine-protein kinase
VKVQLIVTEGPHFGRTFTFEEHDTFLVGRIKEAHLQLSYDDPYFSRRHFLVEINPPRCRVFDLKSRNGIYVNGERVEAAELKHQDQLRAGHTVFRVEIEQPSSAFEATLEYQGTGDAGVPAAAPVATPPELLPDTIPGFRIEKEIGRGGMGVVYRAVRQWDSLPVALKVLSTAQGVAGRQLDKFLREAQVMAGLKHPNIAGFIESGRIDSIAFLAMELVEGPDVGVLLKSKGALPISHAVRITFSLLTGLAHAHSKGIVHRDIKPSNVLLGGPANARVVKVADFGLARAYDECKLSGITMQGDVGGTPAFMAPEQVTHFRDVKPPADQYAAAATLYNLLTNAYPIDLSKEIGKQLVQLLTQKPVPIRSRRPEVPQALADVIHKAMASSPSDRYPDTLAFRNALLPFAKS